MLPLQTRGLLNLGPRFVPHSLRTAISRQKRELLKVTSTLQRVGRRFMSHERVVGLTKPFMSDLEMALRECHNTSARTRRNTFSKEIKRLRSFIPKHSIVLRKTDKSKVFHTGTEEMYEERVKLYMQKTNAYEQLGRENPLQDLIHRTNEFLRDLKRNGELSQKFLDRLLVDSNQTELAHLYFQPKAHKSGTPLRPIVAGIKSPTAKISKLLDDILRPLFEQLAKNTSVKGSIFFLLDLMNWSNENLTLQTRFCTMDIVDLYTMIPQDAGLRSLERMFKDLSISVSGRIRTSTLVKLASFVMKNNYFIYQEMYYRQIRGGAMGSALTLSISNIFMFYFERPIVERIQTLNGFYRRFIDDIFLAIETSEFEFARLIEEWNQIDAANIQMIGSSGLEINYLDIHLSNENGQLVSSVFHKPSHELYYLPFRSTHVLHIKKNIPFGALVRALRYSSNYTLFLTEVSYIYMALCFNGYYGEFIQKQFSRVYSKYGLECPGEHNYSRVRSFFLGMTSEIENRILAPLDFQVITFFHFTYCEGMETIGARFHRLWEKHFSSCQLRDVEAIVGFRNAPSLLNRLVQKKPPRELLT